MRDLAFTPFRCGTRHAEAESFCQVLLVVDDTMILHGWQLTHIPLIGENEDDR
jgi:hypothetical protein